MLSGDDLRVADVVREHADRRGDRSPFATGSGRSATGSSTSARAVWHGRCSSWASGHGSRVAYLDRTAPELVELLFAASKIGAVVVPLNWRLAPPELRRVIDDAAPRVLVAGATYAEIAGELAAGASRPELVVVDGGAHGYEALLAAHDSIDPGGRGDRDDVVLQLYTSGTTGVPKGVLTTHRNLTAAAETSPYWEFDQSR